MKSEAKQRRHVSSSARRALDVEIGLLLAGEAGIRQILRRGAAAHGDIRRVRVAAREAARRRR